MSNEKLKRHDEGGYVAEDLALRIEQEGGGRCDWVISPEDQSEAWAVYAGSLEKARRLVGHMREVTR